MQLRLPVAASSILFLVGTLPKRLQDQQTFSFQRLYGHQSLVNIMYPLPI